MEGVHFRRSWGSDALLGRKALSVNLSDIDAMGGQPRYATVSVCLPSETPLAFVDGLYDGLLQRGGEAGVQIVGGNLSRTHDAIVVDVALIGQADTILPRNGARPGHVALVTGDARGRGPRRCASWTKANARELKRRRRGRTKGPPHHAQLDPTPPAPRLGAPPRRAGLAHAAIDLSTGLSGDLTVCQESGAAAWVDPAAVPRPAPPRRPSRRGGAAIRWRWLLHGGEDYQLPSPPPGGGGRGLRRWPPA
jgi:thiamine-monophosphate kinase